MPPSPNHTAQQAPPPLDSEPVYKVEIRANQERGGHTEYEICVVHRSRIQWEVWRRFSEIHQLHADLGSAGPELQAERRLLPPPPPKTFFPSALHGLAGDFVQTRRADLQRYLDAVVTSPRISRHSSVQQLLGVCVPAQPARVRLVQAQNSGRDVVHELEICPDADAEAAPVEGYEVEIRDMDSGRLLGPPLRRDVGCDGQLPQKARLGRLSGVYRFAVVAFNYAGISVPAFVEVNTLQGLSHAQDPEAMREVRRCGAAPQVPRALSGDAVGLRPMPAAGSPSRVQLPQALVLQQDPRMAALAERARMQQGLPTDPLRQQQQQLQPQTLQHSYPGAQGHGPVALSAQDGRQAGVIGRVLGSPLSPASAEGCAAATDGRAQATYGGGAYPAGAPWRGRPVRGAMECASAAPAAPCLRPAAQRLGPAAAVPSPPLRGAGTPPLRGAPAANATNAAAPAARGAGEAPTADVDDDQLCVVCLSAAKTHAFLPCGHRCVCDSCGSEILSVPSATCPICRGAAASFIQIFT